ncbi:LppX_LprAFG lipoprotein [Streptomyces sp. JHA26]|uniref:LppX_LprAFG lipoprotein n=1 Tax=Streptomyces sp. JHA26 TaxID=1917143 RepID=UPI00098BC849|nr:LppX_LprAFG lipoprotein [Streptomyces sp. JHA26]
MGSKGMKAGAIATAVVMGGVALTGCGGDSEPEAGGTTAAASASSSAGAREQGTTAVRDAYDRTAEAETAKLTIKVKADANGRSVTADGRGALDLAEGDSTMTITAEGRSVEQRVVDQVLYQKVPGQEAGGKPWTRIDLKRVAGQQGVDPQQIGDPAQSAAYARAITDKDVSEVGTEKIDGVDTTHYKVSIDVAKLPGGARLGKQIGPTLPMRIWLDDEGRIRRQQIDMTLEAPASARPEGGAAPQRVKVSTLMEFSDFGTEVDAEAPPAGQVTDVTDRVAQGGRTRT